MTPTKPTPPREPNTVLLQRCPLCREFARAGSAEAKRCVDCGTPLPDPRR